MQADIQAIARLIREIGELEIPSSGTSMRPLIREGDRCRFVPLAGRPSLGDILLVAEADGRLVGHRLIRVAEAGEETLYICKGDSNLNPDAPARANQIIGKMTDIRKRRFVMRADQGLARWWGRLLVRRPGLSRLIRQYVRAERRLRRLRQPKGGQAADGGPASAGKPRGAEYEHPHAGKKRGSL
jgi:signal peptidase I